MSGKIKSEIVGDEEKTRQWVNQFFAAEVQNYFRLTPEQITNMSPVECATVSYVLASQSVFLQKKINSLRAYGKEIEHNINKIIVRKMMEYSQYVPADHKRMFAIQDNDVAQQLNDLAADNDKKILALDFLANRVEFTAKMMSEVKRAKYDATRSND